MPDLQPSALAEFRSWWASSSISIPPEVVGLVFGLTTIADPELGAVTTAYLSGSDAFDPDDEAGDWACDPIWWPANKYLPLRGVSQTADWLRAEQHLLELVVATVNTQELPSTIQGVGVGWDDGDLHVTWTRSEI